MNEWNQVYTRENDTSSYPPLNKLLLCCAENKIEIGEFRINGDGKICYNTSHDIHITRFPEYWMEVEIPELAKENYVNKMKQYAKENIDYEKQKIKESQDRIEALKGKYEVE